MEECNHKLVFSGEYFATNPKRYAYACELCDEVGVTCELPEHPVFDRELYKQLLLTDE